MNLLVHALLALIDAVALAYLARRPGVQRFLVGLFAVLIGIWALATLIGRQMQGSFFAYVRLLAHGIAIHFPIFLGVAAWILFRQHHRRPALVAGLGALALALGGLNGFWFEPRWLEVSRHTVRHAKVEKPFRIVVLADYQTDAFGPYERRVWDTAQAQNADLIVLPGDYLQVYNDEKYQRLLEETREYLRQIRFGESARMGAFAIDGDIDLGHANWIELFDGVPVQALQRTQTIELPELTLTALTVRDSRERSLKVAASPRFHVAFGHAPDYALLDLDIDLQIAGHTHGGQLRVPGFGPLVTFSRVPRSWAAGVTDLGRGRTLIVSRGIGMERGNAPRLRFLCRPEIVVLDVEPLVEPP